MSKKKTRRTKMKKPKSRTSGDDGPIVSLLRPRKTETIEKIAKEFMDDKKPNLNAGIYSQKELDALKEDGVEPYIYSPVIVEIGRRTSCAFAIKGQASRNKKAPAGWNNKILGAHEPGMKIDQFRLNHSDDVRKMVANKEEHIITIGAREYIVGTADTPAIFCVNAARSGNYEANIEVAKYLAFNGLKEIANLVGQINNKVDVAKFEDGQEMVWLPGHAVTWGYIEKDGKQLTYAQTRAAVTDKSTGTKFVALNKPIVSNGVSESEWWAGIKKSMSAAGTKDSNGQTALDRFQARKSRSTEQKDARVKGWANLTKTQVRCHPGSFYCFGFRNIQLGMPIFTCFSEDGKTELIKFAIGQRLATNLAETKRVINRRIKGAKGATATVAKSKSKAEKKVSKKTKTATKKPASKKKAKKQKTKQLTTIEKSPIKDETIIKEEPVMAAPAPAPEFSDEYDEGQELVDVDIAQMELAEQDINDFD